MGFGVVSEAEPGSEAGSEAGLEAGSEAGLGAGSEVGSEEAGSESGVEATPSDVEANPLGVASGQVHSIGSSVGLGHATCLRWNLRWSRRRYMSGRSAT